MDYVEGLGCGVEGCLNLCVRVGCRNEIRFKLAAGEVDAPLQHRVKITGEQFRIAVRGCGQIRHRRGIEEQCEHAPHMWNRLWNSRLFREFREALNQRLGHRFQTGVGIGFLERGQGGNSTGHRDRIARQGTGLIDRTEW